MNYLMIIFVATSARSLLDRKQWKLVMLQSPNL